ncbi:MULTISPECIES: hypothetical protein [unclassified Gordonia (in: high G+C Gram-positive bacteria)]|uniref:hypothetical protein n=1 Tax=unclassified Gordonia (in: high G+C Gram-positive bacteria) TaxID=2657482 RepID=UPI00027DEA59|nr:MULTISPECIES: hypothetical protein [unclassified Gordonia (in: high G+C Gram-positive bacteria)]AFR51127.1 hypothetical protein KTR9_4523 [Gordonia sp. KTR9]
MNGEGCWSTVVCRPAERAALGLSGDSDWLLQCRLAIGHRGNHATDASTHPRHDRRLWLEWNDFDDRAQSLIERNPCPVPSPEGAGCVFFAGHGGPHFYARSNGHAPSVMTGAGAPNPQSGTPDRAVDPHRQSPPRMGSHRLPDSHPAASLSAQPPAPADPEPHTSYRGGRRSTNVEPLTADDYHGRRHRTDGYDVAYSPSTDPADPLDGPGVGSPGASGPVVGGPGISGPTAVRPGSGPTGIAPGNLPAVPGPDPGAPGFDAARVAAIGAALDEVATALAKLAAALRS